MVAKSGELRDWIFDMAQEWISQEYIPSIQFQQAYDKFCFVNKIKIVLTIPKLHEAFEKWCEWYGYEYSHSVRKRIEGQQQRCCFIRKKEDTKQEKDQGKG
jgi:hypothetical protein